MEHLSPRVRDFIHATVTLLSPVSSGHLSDKERAQIIYYAQMIIDELSQPASPLDPAVIQHDEP
jgi:hypothetical protein